MPIIELKNENDYYLASSHDLSNSLVIIEFTASWCGPCKMIAPKLNELNEQLGERVKFFKLDVDNFQNLLAQEKINAVPTFQFFYNGKLIDSFSGANYQNLVSTIENNLKYISSN